MSTKKRMREGDYYQDLVSLKIALELYNQGISFELFPEYMKKQKGKDKKNIEDIRIHYNDQVETYQVKLSNDPRKAYKINHFIKDCKSGDYCYFKPFLQLWLELRKNYSPESIRINLFTTRGVDSEVNNVIKKDGRFKETFIRKSKRGHYKKARIFRNFLTEHINNEEELEFFLDRFKFNLLQPSVKNLTHIIKNKIIKEELKLYDPNDYLFSLLLLEIQKCVVENKDGSKSLTSKRLSHLIQDFRNQKLPYTKTIEKKEFFSLLKDQFEQFKSEEIDVTNIFPLKEFDLSLRRFDSIDFIHKGEEFKHEDQKINFNSLITNLNDTNAKSHLIVSGIAGIGKTSSSLQIAFIQLKRVMNGNSLYLPIWFQLGRSNHQKILQQLLRFRTTRERILYLLNSGNYMTAYENKFTLKEYIPPFNLFWILDGWNEASEDFRFDTQLLNMLCKESAFLLFSRPASEPQSKGYDLYQWQNVERYDLEVFTVDAASNFLIDVFNLDPSIAKIVVAQLSSKFRKLCHFTPFTPLFLCYLFQYLDMNNLLSNPDSIESFFTNQTTIYSLLDKFIFDILRREYKTQMNRLPSDRIINRLLDDAGNIIWALTFEKSSNSKVSFDEIKIDHVINEVNCEHIDYFEEIIYNIFFPKKYQKGGFLPKYERQVLHEIISDFLLARTIIQKWESPQRLSKIDLAICFRAMSNSIFQNMWMLIEEKWSNNHPMLINLILDCFEFRRKPDDHQDDVLEKILKILLKSNRSPFINLQFSDLGVIKADLSSLELNKLPNNLYQLQYLRELNLENNNLSTLPPEIKQFKNLQILNAAENNLFLLPAEIGELTNLENLDLVYNKLTSLPPEIAYLKNLRSLDLEYNEISHLPPEIGDLRELEDLNLCDNNLSAIPPEIGRLYNLRSLGAFNNDISSIPSEIGQLNCLFGLGLSCNQISTLPVEIGNLANLKVLTLTGNQVNSLPREIGQLKNLQDFFLANNNIKSLPVEIGHLKNLEELVLTNNQLSYLPHGFGQLKNLVGLLLDDNKLTKLPPEFTKLEKLERLTLDNNSLESLPNSIEEIFSLRFLSIPGNPLVNLPGNLPYCFFLELLMDNEQVKLLPKSLRRNMKKIHKNLYLIII